MTALLCVVIVTVVMLTVMIYALRQPTEVYTIEVSRRQPAQIEEEEESDPPTSLPLVSQEDGKPLTRRRRPNRKRKAQKLRAARQRKSWHQRLVHEDEDVR